MKNQTLKLIIIAALIGGGFYLLSGPSEAQYGITIPKVKALYEDNLQAKITSSATTMTLVRGTDKQDRDLSGTYGFVIDEGSPVEEFVICTSTATALSGCLRGIDVENGKTEVATLKQPHRRGASVKITNYPQLAIISRVLNGDEGVPNLLYYDSQIAFGSATTTALAYKQWVIDLTNQGAATSSTLYGGILEQATAKETASSTASDGDLAYAIPPNLATSTPGTTCDDSGDSTGVGALCIPVAENDGKLNQIWLDWTENFAAVSGDWTLTGDWNFNQTAGSATTTLGATTTAMFGERGALVPVGTILIYTATTSPDGWIICDGTAISRTTFSDLYNVIGTAFGDGDGSTTFNLPNLTQRLPMGLDTDAADGIGVTIGETGGATSTNQTIAQMPAHTHYFSGGTGSGGATTGSTAKEETATSVTGGAHDTPTLDPYLVVNYIIKY